jgi:flagella basal body P-ring formation protein FlgA
MMPSFHTMILRCRTSRIIALTMIFAAVGSVKSLSAADIVILLHENAKVHSEDIQLRDIAKIRHRDRKTVQEIGDLVLETFPDQSTPLEITASSVRIRLVLQGWSAQQIQLMGAEKTQVTYEELRRLTDPEIESAALQTLMQAMEVPAEDLQVRLVGGFVEGLPANLIQINAIRPEVLPPVTEGPGQMSLTVRLWNGNELLVTRVVRFDVMRKYRVAVVKTLMRRDDPLNPDNVQFERRFSAVRLDEPRDEELIDRKLRKDVRAGEIISMSNLATAIVKSRPYLVNKRSMVRVIAKSGLVQVTLQAAEAMQSGREGDLIQVRNPESKKLIVGRVTASGDVEIRIR